MENAQPFIGIDPDDTQEVKIGGGIFTIGVIDQGLWERIEDEDGLANRAALRRITKYLAENGEDPNADAVDEGGKPIIFKDDNGRSIPIHRAAMMVMRDPQYGEELHRLMVRAAKYAVRAHSGWVRRDGTAVPCELVEETLDFGTVKRLSDTTLRRYAVNRDLLTGLWLAIKRLQTLGPREKKVLPPPSLETPGGSTAGTAPESPTSNG